VSRSPPGWSSSSGWVCRCRRAGSGSVAP
jgi:hypothetical protein